MPTTEVAGLFGHLVSASEKCGWNIKAERLGSLQIDDRLVLGRRLHRQISWLLALEDAVDVAGRAAILFLQSRSVGRKTTGRDEVAERIDRSQPVAFRNRRDLAGIVGTERAGGHDQSAFAVAPQRGD